MSDGEDDLIIIKRHRGDQEEEHHGGVWKLAFADFMTAMMAFFLVMWLINSTSKETKASIVQYFNPIQLVDSNPAHQGLRDPKTGGQGKGDQPIPDSGAASEALERERQEEALHRQPIRALDAIAKLDPPSPPATEAYGADAPAIHDPFDRIKKNEKDFSESERENVAANRAREADDSPKKRPPAEAKALAESAKSGPSTTPVAMQEALEKIARNEAAGAKGAPHIEVTRTDEGLVISLTDDANFSMFRIGSIEPKPQLVRILSQVGRLLAGRPGNVEVRGHTDARSYKTASYDNWRLSSDRANVANYMLVRGGLAETRISKIVGYADRNLKTPKDPLAPANRRIEILLREDGR